MFAILPYHHQEFCPTNTRFVWYCAYVKEYFGYECLKKEISFLASDVYGVNLFVRVNLICVSQASVNIFRIYDMDFECYFLKIAKMLYHLIQQFFAGPFPLLRQKGDSTCTKGCNCTCQFSIVVTRVTHLVCAWESESRLSQTFDVLQNWALPYVSLVRFF